MTTFYMIDKLYDDHLKMRASIDTKTTVTFDYAAWAATHGTVTSVNLVVKSGTLSITNESLTSNVRSATLQFTQAGMILIEIQASTSSEKKVNYLSIRSQDRSLNNYNGDYRW